MAPDGSVLGPGLGWTEAQGAVPPPSLRRPCYQRRRVSRCSRRSVRLPVSPAATLDRSGCLGSRPASLVPALGRSQAKTGVCLISCIGPPPISPSPDLRLRWAPTSRPRGNRFTAFSSRLFSPSTITHPLRRGCVKYTHALAPSHALTANLSPYVSRTARAIPPPPCASPQPSSPSRQPDLAGPPYLISSA